MRETGLECLRFMKEVFEIDVREVAPKVRCPTLVRHAIDDPCFPTAISGDSIASGPNGDLFTVIGTGNASQPYNLLVFPLQ